MAAGVAALDLSGQGITDLTGLVAFTELSALDVSNNSLLNLNITSNQQLTRLNTSGNLGLLCITINDIAAAEAQADFVVDDDTIYSTDPNCREQFQESEELPMPKWALFGLALSCLLLGTSLVNRNYC